MYRPQRTHSSSLGPSLAHVEGRPPCSPHCHCSGGHGRNGRCVDWASGAHGAEEGRALVDVHGPLPARAIFIPDVPAAQAFDVHRVLIRDLGGHAFCL